MRSVLAAATTFAGRANELGLGLVSERVQRDEVIYKTTFFGRRPTGERRLVLVSERLIGWHLITCVPGGPFRGMQAALEQSKQYFVTQAGTMMYCDATRSDPRGVDNSEGAATYLHRPSALKECSPEFARELVEAMAKTLLEPDPLPRWRHLRAVSDDFACEVYGAYQRGRIECSYYLVRSR